MIFSLEMRKMHPIAKNTLKLMLKKGIKIRDTLFPYSQGDRKYVNLDNYYINGKKYKIDDPFKVDIIWNSSSKFGGKSGAKGLKVYSVPQLKSLALDISPIIIHPRYSAFYGNHVIAHELVHKFQHLTHAEEKNYIEFNRSNWLEYMSQRVELEAHFIQCIYLFRFTRQWIENIILTMFSKRETIEFLREINNFINKPFSENLAKELILKYVDLHLIGPNAIKLPNKNNENLQPMSIIFTAEEFYQLINKNKYI